MSFQSGLKISNEMMDTGFSESIITTTVHMRRVAKSVDEMDRRLLEVLDREGSTQRDLQNLLNEMARERPEGWPYNPYEIPRITIPQCNNCAHLIPVTITCDAFPNGIPKEIHINKFDHKNPYPGDNGIRFTPESE